MKRAIKIISIAIASFIAILLVLYIGASLYLTNNKKEIIAKVSKTIGSKFQSVVTIEDIDVTLFQNFPNLSLVVKNIDVKGGMFNIHGKNYLPHPDYTSALHYIN